jgi:predicted dehydrogenase
LHIYEIQACGKFDIRAVADLSIDIASVEKFGIPHYYTDYKEMLEKEDIDAVLVTSPHHLHEEHCVASFKAGKHVIVEKPISRNLQEAKNMLDAAKQSGKIAMMGFCQRFYPKHVYIKNLIKENKLGQLLSARIDHYQNFRPAETSWWRDENKVGGGAIIGSGVHRLDLLRWYLGEPVSVYAKAVKMPERLSAEACVHSVIEFDSGVIANFSINWASHKFLYGEGLSISGKNGLVTVNNSEVAKIGLKEIDNGILKDFTAPKCRSMFETFANSIENNVQPECSFEEGYKTLKLVRALYKSIETGKIVNPNDVEF